jgi:archaellum component FlaF (FlaF/FlaG flagellin family)
MGYAVIIFVILLLTALTIALTTNYGVSKDSQEAPLFAENAYADREAGKMQTDFVVEALKVNGTMYYSSVVTNSPQTIHLHLTIRNNGSFVLTPLKYSILLNKTWVPINSASDNSTYPLMNSTTHSLDLTQKPLNLTITSENGVKITVPSPPRFTSLSASPNTSDNCWRDLTVSWNVPSVSQWPIDHYALYYTWADNINKNDTDVAFTTGSTNSAFIGNAFRKVGANCGANNASNSLYVWMTAFDTHGNEGVPTGTCSVGMGGSSGENCP